MEYSILIARPIEDVFQLVTTPTKRPQWHLLSVGVEGAIHHAGYAGENIRERIRLGTMTAEF